MEHAGGGWIRAKEGGPPDARRGLGIKLYIRCGDAVALQSLTDEPDND